MILIAETLLVAAVCTSTKRSSFETLLYTTGGQSAFEISSGISLERHIANKLCDMNGVQNARVTLEKDQLYIEVDLWNFDKATRRAVYARERELYREYPDLSIGLHLVDASMVATNAIAG